jgi:hypothetical protein
LHLQISGAAVTWHLDGTWSICYFQSLFVLVVTWVARGFYLMLVIRTMKKGPACHGAGGCLKLSLSKSCTASTSLEQRESWRS